MAIPESFIQDMLARADVVETVGRYVKLKKAGVNYTGLCPFHNEKSPSFSVNPHKQFYHCFGCGKSGDALRFLMDFAGLSFVEAVQDLAASLGLSIPQDQRSPQELARAAQLKDKQSQLTQILHSCATAWQKNLETSPKAQAYLKQRGLNTEVIEQYGLGYAPENRRFLANIFSDYTDPLLQEAGLVIVSENAVGNNAAGQNAASAQNERRYDRFRDRITFPIRNQKGAYIGFGGRILNATEHSGPKYLNSPETPVFKKGKELYGLFEARSAIDKAGYALITEGYMDVVALAQHGFGHAVATLGTACTPEHIEKLFRYTSKIVFAFDGDPAGRRAARKALDTALPYASDTRNLHFLFLPPEHDPDSYIRDHGADAFARAIANAVPLSQMLLDAARNGCDLSNIEGRSRMASQAKDLWQPLPEGSTKRQILRALAGHIDLNERELLELWNGPQDKPSYSLKSKNSAKPNSDPGRYSKTKPSYNPRPVPLMGPARRAPSSRIDRALGLLFSHAALWDNLSHEDHALLCHWPPPYGELFTLLDSQTLENGPQNWPSLAAALRHHPAYALLQREVDKNESNSPSPTTTTANNNPQNQTKAQQAELQDVLQRLRSDHIQNRLNTLARTAARDPSAYAEYQRLLGEYQNLRAQIGTGDTNPC